MDSIIERVRTFGVDDWLENTHMLMLMDDTVIVGTSRAALQEKLNLAASSLEEIGMKVNQSKSAFITVGTKDTDPFRMGEAEIQFTDSYKYLGTLIANKTVKEQMKMHLQSKRSQTLKFAAFLHKNNDAPFTVKKKVWNAALLASVMYSCDTWLCADLRPAESLYNSTLKELLGVRLTTCNDLVLLEAGVPASTFFIKQQQKNLLERIRTRQSYDGSNLQFVMQLAINMGCPMGRAMQNLETENFNQDPLHSIRQELELR